VKSIRNFNLSWKTMFLVYVPCEIHVISSSDSMYL
jgi:hypothetical protein